MRKNEIEPFYPYLGKLLRKARESQGVTQKQLGEQLGLHHTTITCYEMGTNRIRTLEFAQLCDALMLDPNEVIGRARSESDALILPRQANRAFDRGRTRGQK